jgi:hypothetical protein
MNDSNRRYTNILYKEQARAKSCCGDNCDYIQEIHDVNAAVVDLVKLCNR